MRLGQHQTTGKRLHRLGFVSTYQVGQSTDRLLAKVIEADGLPADEMLNHASDDLLASAKLQQAADEVPGIVRVVDVGEHQDGRSTQAYAIYERYDDNARLFLGPRARPAAVVVVDIIEQARAALQGFAVATGRPHGHATLSNILLRKQSDSTVPAVALTDPLPAIADPTRAAQADRRALGNLLLAVVTGRSAEALRSVEVPPDRDWTTIFGSVGGNAARQLCHDLLFDTGTELPDAETLQQGLRERQGPVNTKSIAAAAALLLLVLAAGLGWMLMRPPAAPTAQLADAAEALARYPTHFRRFVHAEDPESPGYQRLSEFLVLLSADPWNPDAVRQPPTGLGTVHDIDAQLRSADQRLTTSQLGRTSTALEGLWRAIATTPDDAPPDRWDAVARGMLAVGQDETSRNAELMFGAITTMADNFSAAAEAADAFADAQRARIESIRDAFRERGVDGSLESITILEQRLAALDEALFEFFAPRVLPATTPTGLPSDPGSGAAGPSSGSPAANEDGTTRAASMPGLPDLSRFEIAQLFDEALAVEDLLRTIEAELARTNDLGEPLQIVQGLRGDAFTQFAPPAFREQARAPLNQIASALARDLDASLATDLTTLLDERDANGRWDTTVDRARRFTGTAGIRTTARALTDRLRRTGVVAELGWLADDESQWLAALRAVPALDSDTPAERWSLAEWSSMLAAPRFTADPQRYAIDGWIEQLESWESALRAADETNDPRYAELRTRAADALRAPEASQSLAHWPTAERHGVVTARYDDLLERTEVAVRVLDPCFPIRAEFIESTLTELEARLAGPIDGISPETADLIRGILATVRDRDEVRADRSATPAHPRQQCANAARFAQRLDELIAVLIAERAEAGELVDQSWSDRFDRVTLAGLAHAWFADGQSPTTEGWTKSLAARMFAEQPPSATAWARPDAVADAVRTLHDLQKQLDQSLESWAWADADGFDALQRLIDAIDHAHATAQGTTPPIMLGAAIDEPWQNARITAGRLLAAEQWLCADQPSEQRFRRAIIAGALPEDVLTPELQGNWLQADAEFAFLWVRRRTGCPTEQLPIPESSDEFLDTARLVEVMQTALQAAPVDAVDSFPELEQLPDRLRTEALIAVVGYTTNHMTTEEWIALTDTDSESIRDRRRAFARLGMPLDPPDDNDSTNPWLNSIDGMPAVSPRASANWALWNAITRLNDPDNAEEPRARAIIDQLVDRWSAIARQAAEQDSQFVQRARDMASLPGQLAARPPDFTIPGALPSGWTARETDNLWNAIDITIPNHGTHRFVGARSGRSQGYPTAYIAQNELSIGLINALLDALPDAPQRELIARLNEAADLNRSTLAPAGWTIQNNRVAPTDPVTRSNEVDRAIDGSLSSHGWFSLLPRRDGGFANDAARQPTIPGTNPPTADTPIHMLPAEIMVDLLARIPTSRPPRLPTLDEWQQLAGSFSAGPHTLNLRDRAFHDALLAEFEFLGHEPDNARFITTFRIGRTARDAAERILPNAAAQELRRPYEASANDRHPLFASVSQEGWLSGGESTTRLRHAFGNVAEVIATPGQEFTHAVLGGSALSTPNEFGEALNNPIPLRARDLGRPFTDVGFRIAIEAPEGQPYAQVALRTLRDFGFLPPTNP